MVSSEQFRQNLREAEMMTRSGITEDSLPLSGELLAKASYHLDQIDSTENGELFAEAAVVHVNALIASDEHCAAVSTAICSLLRLSMLKDDTTDLGLASMMLLNLSASSLVTHMREHETTPSDDVIEHYTTVLRYLTSMLFHYYTRLNNSCPQSVLLKPVYKTLRHLIDEGVPVDQNEIGVNNKSVNPDSPLPIYSDAIGRLRAVGFQF